MDRNRTRDRLGAFLPGAQRGLPLSLLRYHANFSLDQKRASVESTTQSDMLMMSRIYSIVCTENATHIYMYKLQFK